MQEMEIKKLRRPQLVEMIQNLMHEQETTKQELAAAQEKLQDRSIAIDNAGSLAEAVCKVNGIMEAADSAAAQYLENVRRQNEEAEGKGQQMLEETKARCSNLEEETRIRCENMIASAKEEAQAYWDEVYVRLQQYCKASDALKELTQPIETKTAI